MRPDPSGVLSSAAHARTGIARILIQPHMASTYAGQHAAWMLVNLVCRQFGLVVSIELDVPDVPLLDGVAPFGESGTLKHSLASCVQLVSGSHVAVVDTDSTFRQPDIVLVVGSDLVADAPENTWYIHADGWRCYVGRHAKNLPIPSPTRTALGPYLAAAFGAGEIFKVLRGMNLQRGAFIDELFASAWTMSTAGSWCDLSDGLDASELALPHLYFAGAGAVAQACMLALGASGIRGSATIIDHDVLDITNSNRYVLSHGVDDGEFKVDVAKRYLDGVGIVSTPVPCRWNEFVVGRKEEWLTPGLEQQERNLRFGVVLSCVDKNHPRHEIQNALPELIVGGSTDGLTAKAQIYDLGMPTSCLKCFNPVEDMASIARDQLERARKGSDEERSAICEELGVSPEELERAMNATGCGQLTPSDIERFGAGAPEMSVGFVSAAAGALQAAQLLRVISNKANNLVCPDSMAVCAFSHGRLGSIRPAPDEACDCGAGEVHVWRRLWGVPYE